jgi:Arc/MetJ-type ribon-helix-helix transcriptional regulator
MVTRVKVPISKDIIKIIQKEVKASGGEFKNVTEYIEFVLTELLEDVDETAYTPEEEEKIRERLRALGYIE